MKLQIIQHVQDGELMKKLITFFQWEESNQLLKTYV